MKLLVIKLKLLIKNENIKYIGSKIYENIDKEIYIVCRDMNKSYTDIEPFLNDFDCIKTNETNILLTSVYNYGYD
jgi:hypothetical protein